MTKMQELKQKIEDVKVVSFDLYQTLVFRKTRLPQDIFSYLEFYTGISGFADGRAKVQRKAAGYVHRKYGHPHPNMQEIYRFWSHSCRKIREVEQTERDLEEYLTVCNLAMQKMMRYAKACGKRVLITSDMYLERYEIEKILEKCSITEWDELYVSSEIRKTKYDGTIYDYILKKERITADQMLHVGDDKHADMEMAGRKGIRTFWYRDRERHLAQSLYAISHSGQRPPLKNEMAFWYNLGYRTGGPLYLGLCLWIRERLRNKKLFCLSRDGCNLVRLLPRFGISDVSYIYTSRRALLMPYFTKAEKNELQLMPPYSCGQTVGEILHYFGLEELSKTQLKEAGFESSDSVIQNKNDIAKIKRLYKMNEEWLLERCRQERANLESYFSAEGLFQNEVCFFDSGWNGTSQYLLTQIYRSLHRKSSIRFYYAGIKQTAGNKKRLTGCPYESYFDLYADKQVLNRMLASSAVLELFFSTDAPAVRCYGESGIQFDAYEKREYIRWLNQGIEDYVEQNQALIELLSEEAVRRFGVYNLSKLVLAPDSREAERIGNIENADRLSAAAGMKKYVGKIAKGTLRKNPFLDIYWEQGVYRHPQNAPYIKAFVWFRQRAAGLYHAADRVTKNIRNTGE